MSEDNTVIIGSTSVLLIVSIIIGYIVRKSCKSHCRNRSSSIDISLSQTLLEP